MRALHSVGVLNGFCKILNNVKSNNVITTITILSQMIYIAHPYLLFVTVIYFGELVANLYLYDLICSYDHSLHPVDLDSVVRDVCDYFFLNIICFHTNRII